MKNFHLHRVLVALVFVLCNTTECIQAQTTTTDYAAYENPELAKWVFQAYRQPDSYHEHPWEKVPKSRLSDYAKSTMSLTTGITGEKLTTEHITLGGIVPAGNYEKVEIFFPGKGILSHLVDEEAAGSVKYKSSSISFKLTSEARKRLKWGGDYSSQFRLTRLATPYEIKTWKRYADKQQKPYMADVRVTKRGTTLILEIMYDFRERLFYQDEAAEGIYFFEDKYYDPETGEATKRDITFICQHFAIKKTKRT